MMTIQNKIIPLMLFLASLAHAETKDQQLLYQVDTKLFYSDKLINPVSTINWRHLQGQRRSKRGIGLSESKIDLNWITNSKTHLRMTLRPDNRIYTSTDGKNIEFDSRSGKTFRSPSSLRFLDAYAVSVDAGDSFNFTAGVFEAMAPLLLAYENILEFGLNTRLIRKYSGLHIQWKIDNDAFPKSQPEALLGKRFSIHIFQNSDDRNERYEGGESLYDVAPSSEDPHQGIGFGYDWRPSSSFQLMSLVAFRRNENQAVGKSTDLIARLGWMYNFKAYSRSIDLAQDLRYNRVRYNIEGVSAKTLNQTSGSLSVSAWLKDDFALYGGLHLGQSEQHNKDDPSKADIYNGWQADIGVKRIVNDSLVGHLILSSENRSLDKGTDTVGGFSAPPSDKGQFNRFALLIHYKLGGP